MAVPFVGTPKLLDTNFLFKKEKKGKKRKNEGKKMERESNTKLFIVKL